MTIQLFLRWWYGPGLAWVWKGLLVDKLHYVSEVFSVPEMIATLFAPFRQTYVGKSGGTTVLQAFVDRTVSRGIGFVVRLALLLVAFLASVLIIVVGCALCITWPFMPILPVVALALALLGVGA